VRIARRQHQRRHVLRALQPAADLGAVEAGEHPVEHDEIRAQALTQRQPAGPS